MKKIIFALSCLCLFGINVSYGQAKKPTIMLVPSDAWCISHNYFMEVDNQGTLTKIPDYKKAIQMALTDNTELTGVIQTVNKLMVDRSFPLQDLGEQIKILEKKAAKQSMTGAKTNPVSQLKKVAKADIWMYLEYEVKSIGPKKMVTFSLEGKDAYSGKSVAGTGKKSGTPSFSAETTVLLEEACLAHIDAFNSQLQMHFEDLFANGREVTLDIITLDSFAGDLETDFGGQALSRQIKKWLQTNTVKGRFSQVDADADGMEFNQVRIPLFDATGNPTDTQTWAEGLQDYLKTLSVVNVSVGMDGLGAAYLTIK